MKEQLALLKDRLNKFAPRVGYPLFYLFCLIVFASWTFPYARLKERIVASFNAGQRATGSQQELQIDEATSSWVTGVKLTGIRLVTPAAEPGKPPSEMKVESAVARISLLGLLVGNKDVSFHVDAFGGTISGSYDDRGKDRDIELEFDKVDVGQVTPLRDLTGLPMEGSLGGTVKLAMPEAKASKATGAVALEIQDLAVGDGKAKIKGALALPRLSIGALNLAGEAKDGVLTIKKLGAGGKDLEFQGDGRVQLREVFAESLVDMNVRFKVNDAYRIKNDVTKSLFGAPGSNAPALFELADPKVKQSKRADGFYAWHARGPFARLDFLPAGGGFGGGSPLGGAANPFATPGSTPAAGGLTP